MSKISTITKLLAQAKSAEAIGNMEEARIFNDKVAQLCSTSGIDQAQIRQELSAQEKADEMTIEEIYIGTPGSVGLKHRANFAALIVSDMLVVDATLRASGKSITVYGVRSQVEQAIQLVDGLLAQNNAGILPSRKRLRKEGRRFSRIAYDNGFFSEMLLLAQKVSQDRKAQVSDNMPADNISPENYTPANSSAIAVRDLMLDTVDFFERHSNARGKLSLSSSRSRDFGASFAQGSRVGRNGNLSTRKALAA